MTARDDKGNTYKEQKAYYPIGVDLDGYMRYGAWQIKELIDLTLRPKETEKERVVFEFAKDANSADVFVDLYYYISGSRGTKIYSRSKHLEFE